MVRQVPTAVCDGLRGELREFLRLRPDLTAAHVSQYTTLSPTTIRHFMAGTMNGGTDVTSQIRRVLQEAKAGQVLTPGGANAVSLTEDATKRVRRVERRGAFYQTQTVRRIGETLEYCVEHCAIGVITADYGAGKTEAVKEWQRTHAGVVECWVFEFDEYCASNKVDFIRLMGQSFGVASQVGSQNGGIVFRALCDHLRENPCLLIFDQCETIRPRIIQVIRQIHDRTHDAGVGVVILAAPILLARLQAGKMADLGALTSRVGVWAPLTGVTKGEMTAIVRQEGIADIDAAAFDLWFRAVGGSMRRLMRSIDLLKSKHVGKRVTERTITGVAANLWGMGLEL